MAYGFSVIAIHEQWLAPGISMMLLVTMTYIAGRVHQFFKQTNEREEAYRDGYNTATRSLFALATRTARSLPAAQIAALKEPAPSKTLKGYASVPNETQMPLPARHRAAGRRKFNAADTHKYENWPPTKAA